MFSEYAQGLKQLEVERDSISYLIGLQTNQNFGMVNSLGLEYMTLT